MSWALRFSDWDGPIVGERRSREALLDALVEILVTEGFGDWKIGTLASRLSCSRSTLYKLAPTKTGLIVLVLNRLIDSVMADALEAAATPGFSAAEKITAYGRTVALRQSRMVPKLWVDIAESPEARAVFAPRRGAKPIAGFVEEGIRSGELRPVNAEFVSRLIQAGAQLGQDPQVLEASGLDSSEAVSQLLDIILRGVER